MSWMDKMEKKADKLDKSEEERVTILQEIRKENANLGREEGRGARIVTTVIAVVVIIWAVMFIFDIVTQSDASGPTAMLCAVLLGLYWGNYRESRDRTSMIYAIVSAVALVFMLVIHVFIAIG